MAFLDTVTADFAAMEALFVTAEKNLGITAPAGNSATAGTTTGSVAATTPATNQPSTVATDLTPYLPWAIAGVFAYVVFKKHLKG